MESQRIKKPHFFSIAGLLLVVLMDVGCAYIPTALSYQGPKERPREIEEYYAVEESYISFTEKVMEERGSYTLTKVEIQTPLGPSTIDYYKRNEKSDSIVFVFPILGGNNFIEGRFADYFARDGLDTAIINRNSDFKKPENIDRIEEVLRQNVVRDRIVFDFFERELGKKKMGSFGISRGAINAALDAGVDPRLEYNVLALGGSHLAEIFRDTDQKGLQKYKNKVMALKGFTEQELYDYFYKTVRTDPKLVMRYIDARKTLMFLGVFDSTVPIKYGYRLRRGIGRPATFFLPTGHYTSLLYTQFVKYVRTPQAMCVFPLDLVETESTAFYHRNFNDSGARLKDIPYEVAKFPLHVLTTLYDMVIPHFSSSK